MGNSKSKGKLSINKPLPKEDKGSKSKPNTSSGKKEETSEEPAKPPDDEDAANAVIILEKKEKESDVKILESVAQGATSGEPAKVQESKEHEPAVSVLESTVQQATAAKVLGATVEEAVSKTEPTQKEEDILPTIVTDTEPKVHTAVSSTVVEETSIKPSSELENVGSNNVEKIDSSTRSESQEEVTSDNNVQRSFTQDKHVPRVIDENTVMLEEAKENDQEITYIPSEETSAGARARSGKMPVQPIKLYYIPPSPPCRAVMMTARALGLELDLQMTNILQGDHLKPEYLKMNPQHTVPTMDDSGFILWESRAILAYFVNAYGKDDALYPKNPRLRAMVDARLNFDLGTLTKSYLDLYVPVVFHGAEMDEEKMKKLDEALGYLESMLTGRAYVAGDNITIADISMMPTLTNLNALKYNLEAYPLVNAWFERTKLVLEPFGYTEIDHAGGQVFASFVNKGN